MAITIPEAFGNPSATTSTPSAIGGGTLAGLAIIQAVTGAFTQFQAGRARKYIARANERLFEFKATDAKRRGRERAGRVRQRGKKVIGAQRAALAAQGIRVDVGSASDIQRETADITDFDAMTIKNNALREAFGFETRGADIRLESRFDRGATVVRATGTLLTGGIQAASFLRRR